MDTNVTTRFWTKVDKSNPNGCWPWTASKNYLGYGMFRAVSQSRRNMHRAHCWSWELANGPIPEGMAVLHTCDVRHCVNPAHLWLGTQLENLIDRDTKGHNNGLTHLLKINERGGPRLGRPDLSSDDVATIRAEAANGVSRYTLANRYGTSYEAISNIVNWKTYRADGKRQRTYRHAVA